MSDVALPAAPRASKITYERLPGGKLVPVGDLLSQTAAEFSENIGPYVLAALGQMLIAIPIAVAGVLLLYFVIGLLMFAMMAGAFVSIAVLGEDLGGLGAVVIQLLGMIGYIGVIGAFIAGITVVVAPFNASAMRAIAAHQRGEGQPLDITSAFRTASHNLVGVVSTSLAYGVLIFLGLMACYFPVLLVSLFFSFSLSLAALHDLGAGAALSRAFGHARENVGWHVGYVAVSFGIGMLASYVPILGPAFMLAFHVRAHRNLFGDAEPAIEA